jgi:hypothetical protein
MLPSADATLLTNVNAKTAIFKKISFPLSSAPDEQHLAQQV